MQRLHAENHGCQGASQNFRIRKFGALFEILLIVESNTNTVRYTTASTGTLFCRCLTDGFNLKLLNFIAVGVTLHASESRVHDVSDARDRQRGFCNIGRKHNTATAVCLKDAVLLFNA